LDYCLILKKSLISIPIGTLIDYYSDTNLIILQVFQKVSWEESWSEFKVAVILSGKNKWIHGYVFDVQ
jgi:hypothetical protein